MGARPADREVSLWEAINEYAQACGGDTSAKTLSDRRMDAVVVVERALKTRRPLKGDAANVIVESPYASGALWAKRYLARCLHDCVTRDESPYASHAILTLEGVLDDADLLEREKGILLGFRWRKFASKTVVYRDHGISAGMQLGIDHALEIGGEVEYREIGRQGCEIP